MYLPEQAAQPSTPDEVQDRDQFQTPAYAVELLLPYIPVGVQRIWEPAAGSGNIVRALNAAGYGASGTDLSFGAAMNFLTYDRDISFDAIVTNPPFSLKREFCERCLYFGKPFALLIPYDMNVWLFRAMRDYGCRWVVPERRIDFITPTGKSGADSHAQFHSAWLCWRFAIPEMLALVPLSRQTKRGERVLLEV